MRMRPKILETSWRAGGLWEADGGKSMSDKVGMKTSKEAF